MDTNIVRSPVYQQLNARLRAALVQEYRRGDRFLTEREVSERFGVSRATANKSLASLVSEGFLEFRKGLGTFVRRNVIDYDVRSLVSFTEKARAAGKQPSTELLTFGELRAGEATAAARLALGVGEEAMLWEMERLRLADGTPVILEHRYLVHALCPALSQADATGSLYEALTLRHHLKVAGASEVIRAVLLTEREAERLRTAPGAPALEIVAIGLLENDAALWWERTLYRGDQYEFHSRLGPIQSATPAQGRLR